MKIQGVAMAMKTLLIAGSLFLAGALSGCATTIYPVAVYQEGGGKMEGQFAHDWSGSGEVRFTQTVGPHSTNMFYGMVSLAGDRGTTATCGYIGMVTGFLSFNGSGRCIDSKERKYTIHSGSDPGARFESVEK
jgi:hypothetical protein